MMVVTAKDKQILMQALKILSECHLDKPSGTQMLHFAVTVQNLDSFIKRVSASTLEPEVAVTVIPNVTPIGKKKK